MSIKYLTKSRFNLATKCPTKLFYTGKKKYVNKSLDNPFLEALAEGGYQVGELAKHYYPGGHNIHRISSGRHFVEELLHRPNIESTLHTNIRPLIS